jgi:hypothetical protein
MQGRLAISIEPAGLEILLNGLPTGSRTPAVLPLPQGTYEVQVQRRESSALTGRYGWFASIPATVRAGQESAIVRRLRLQPLAQVQLRDAGGSGAQYSVQEGSTERSLDASALASGFYLFPGRYTLIKRTHGVEVKKSIHVTGNVVVSF